MALGSSSHTRPEHDHPEQDRDERVSLGGAEDVGPEQDDELVASHTSAPMTTSDRQRPRWK